MCSSDLWGTSPAAFVAENDKNPNRPSGYLDQQDPTSVFLARVVIPATKATGEVPQRDPNAKVTVDNLSRLFVYSPRALAALGGF